MKIESIWFSVGLMQASFSWEKRGPWKFCGPKGGGLKIFCAENFCIRPPLTSLLKCTISFCELWKQFWCWGLGIIWFLHNIANSELSYFQWPWMNFSRTFVLWWTVHGTGPWDHWYKWPHTHPSPHTHSHPHKHPHTQTYLLVFTDNREPTNFCKYFTDERGPTTTDIHFPNVDSLDSSPPNHGLGIRPTIGDPTPYAKIWWKHLPMSYDQGLPRLAVSIFFFTTQAWTQSPQSSVNTRTQKVCWSSDPTQELINIPLMDSKLSWLAT